VSSRHGFRGGRPSRSTVASNEQGAPAKCREREEGPREAKHGVYTQSMGYVNLSADDLLLNQSEIQSALTLAAGFAEVRGPSRESVGDVLRSAAADSAYRQFRGQLVLNEEPRPLTVSQLALVFESDVIAQRTFDQVAAAAHLRAEVDHCEVAVETVATAGLVGYWGFVHRDRAILVLTLDTLDPQHVSVADLRGLVLAAAGRMVARYSAS